MKESVGFTVPGPRNPSIDVCMSIDQFGGSNIVKRSVGFLGLDFFTTHVMQGSLRPVLMNA